MLESPAKLQPWLLSLGVREPKAAGECLQRISEQGMPADLMSVLLEKLAKYLPNSNDADAAIENLQRYVAASRSPLSLGSLIERDENAFARLIQLFSLGPFAGDVLVTDPEAFDFVRMTGGNPVGRDKIVEEILGEIQAFRDRDSVQHALARYKRRELLRIAYGDILEKHDVRIVSQQLSFLADAICEAALVAAKSLLKKKLGTPRDANGGEARVVMIGLGSLGGCELTFGPNIDLVFLYDGEGRADGEKSVSNGSYFARLVTEFLRLISEDSHDPLRQAVYLPNIDRRPYGKDGPLCLSVDRALYYYDIMGRTWERQTYVKARPVAGDFELGEQFLAEMQPWIYRRYLSAADISGVKAQKRHIQSRLNRKATNDAHKTKRLDAGNSQIRFEPGSIADIESTIKFLQMLNGGEFTELRNVNTYDAIGQMQQVDCLTEQERVELLESYSFLRLIEHRLQMGDFQSENGVVSLPNQDTRLQNLARQMQNRGDDLVAAAQQLQTDYHATLSRMESTLNRLLNDAFPDDVKTGPEVDLLLDPSLEQNEVDDTLAKYGFQNTEQAFHNLQQLSTESVPFLSTRRCRHFLASIVTPLLTLTSRTPNPDATLSNLSRVSDSLGAKGILWELFNVNPPSLELYVRLCAGSPYLSSILTSNPGMLDELMDSLVRNRLPSLTSLQGTLDDLCRGAKDLEPILHNFKNSQHLTAGVRDILGKEDIRNTMGFLADVAEACLNKLTERNVADLERRFGTPWCAQEDRPSELALVALGKLGGREPNYHSNFNLMLVFDDHGTTRHAEGRSGKTTSNQHFFGELAQRIVKQARQVGPFGRLYDIAIKHELMGSSQLLAVSIQELKEFYGVDFAVDDSIETKTASIEVRQMMCQARPIFGSPSMRHQFSDTLSLIIRNSNLTDVQRRSIYKRRLEMEGDDSRHNLKRGSGGTLDVEFIVQALQMKLASESPDVIDAGTINGLRKLMEAKHVTEEHAQNLIEAYRFLRSVEARLRLMNTRARHNLPNDEHETLRLCYLLGISTEAELVEQCDAHRARNRQIFEAILGS